MNYCLSCARHCPRDYGHQGEGSPGSAPGKLMTQKGRKTGVWIDHLGPPWRAIGTCTGGTASSDGEWNRPRRNSPRSVRTDELCSLGSQVSREGLEAWAIVMLMSNSCPGWWRERTASSSLAFSSTFLVISWVEARIVLGRSRCELRKWRQWGQSHHPRNLRDGQ